MDERLSERSVECEGQPAERGSRPVEPEGRPAGRGEGPITQHYKFFNHTACEFYPCHDMPAEQLNCLFCFCPLYCLGSTCGGNFSYIGDIKDCSACTLPHRAQNYEYLMRQFERVSNLAKRTGQAPRGRAVCENDGTD